MGKVYQNIKFKNFDRTKGTIDVQNEFSSQTSTNTISLMR